MKSKVVMMVVVAVIATGASGAPDEVAKAATNDVAGCVQKAGAKPFDIPPSLIFRMDAAHAVALGKELNISNDFDRLELLALGKAGFTNAYEISMRPRGEMKFCDDQMSEEERKSLWPFEVEAFEKALEQKLVRDKTGRYRLVHKDLSGNAKMGDGELEASNPTIRWVNHEIEQWAIQQMDTKFKRMDGKSFCKIGRACVGKECYS